MTALLKMLNRRKTIQGASTSQLKINNIFFQHSTQMTPPSGTIWKLHYCTLCFYVRQHWSPCTWVKLSRHTTVFSLLLWNNPLINPCKNSLFLRGTSLKCHNKEKAPEKSLLLLMCTLNTRSMSRFVVTSIFIGFSLVISWVKFHEVHLFCIFPGWSLLWSRRK